MSTFLMTYGSTEYRRVRVVVTDEAGTPVDPTSFPVHMAFMADGGTPTVSDWNVASWVTSGSNYYARILIGPDGGLDLDESDYYVYVRVDAGVEYPHMFAGILAFQ